MKNKKKLTIIVCIVCVALLIVGIISAVSYNSKYNTVYTFNVELFEEEIKEFSSDKVLGPVDSPKTAKKMAESVWAEIFGKENARSDKPYSVAYDAEHKVWYVHGNLREPLFGEILGGTLQILIEEETGNVLAVWGTR